MVALKINNNKFINYLKFFNIYILTKYLSNFKSLSFFCIVCCIRVVTLVSYFFLTQPTLSQIFISTYLLLPIQNLITILYFRFSAAFYAHIPSICPDYIYFKKFFMPEYKRYYSDSLFSQISTKGLLFTSAPEHSKITHLKNLNYSLFL